MKILIFEWNGVMSGVAEELEKRGHDVTSCLSIEKPEDIIPYDTIVHWNESEIGGSRDFIKYILKWGKRVVIYQHGRRGTPRVVPPFNEPFISDVICVWGENDRDRFLSVGTPKNKVKVTGTPIFQQLKPREKHEGINIVFCPIHWDMDVAENQIIAGTLRKLKGVKITTKVLKDEHDIKMYDNPVVSDRRLEDHLGIMSDVLKTADMVVSPVESTFELMAQYLDIPVVIAGIWMSKGHQGDERYAKYIRTYTSGCKMIKDTNELNDTIYHQLRHSDELKRERHQACVDDGGTNIKDPIKKICDVIE